MTSVLIYKIDLEDRSSHLKTIYDYFIEADPIIMIEEVGAYLINQDPFFC